MIAGRPTWVNRYQYREIENFAQDLVGGFLSGQRSPALAESHSTRPREPTHSVQRCTHELLYI